MIVVKGISVGRLFSNSYLVFDSELKEGVLIDAGDEAEKIAWLVDHFDIEVKGIYLTHGHFDHALAIRDLKEELGCGFYVHKADEGVLASVPSDAEFFLGIKVPALPEPEGWISDGQTIRVGKYYMKVIHTPGHTPGSVCFLLDRYVFTGDTLFAGSIGRTDLHGGSLELLLSSIKTRLLTLPEDFVVYPGHGPSTTIGAEKRMNPFLRDFI